MHALIRVTAAPGQSRRRMLPLALSLAALLLFSHAPSLPAAIFRWDNQALIPGTALITPGPGVQLDHRDLAFANLSNVNLTGANFNSSNLSNALLQSTTLTSVDFSSAQIGGANFEFATFRGLTAAQIYSTASYQEKNLASIRFANNNLTGWDFAPNSDRRFVPQRHANGRRSHGRRDWWNFIDRHHVARIHEGTAL